MAGQGEAKEKKRKERRKEAGLAAGQKTLDLAKCVAGRRLWTLLLCEGAARRVGPRRNERGDGHKYGGGGGGGRRGPTGRRQRQRQKRGGGRSAVD